MATRTLFPVTKLGVLRATVRCDVCGERASGRNRVRLVDAKSAVHDRRGRLLGYDAGRAVCDVCHHSDLRAAGIEAN